MDATLAVLLSFLAVGICLSSRRVRQYLTMIALRRFFDRYLKRPRHRAYFPPGREEKK